MANSSPREPVLRLETITSGPLITIDGREFEIRHPFALSLGALQRLKLLGLEVDAIERKASQGALSEEEEAAWSQRTRALAALVLDAPAEILAALTDVQCTQVVHAFTGLRSQTRAAAAAMGRSTGATSSRASRGSTRARRRRTGTGASRSAS